MVYIWAVEALGKGPSEPKTTEVGAEFDVSFENVKLDSRQKRKRRPNM